MKQQLGVKRGPVWAALLLGLVLQGGIQGGYVRDFWNRNYNSGKGIADNLSPDQIFLQLFGFREFLAGILWVRADSFFDEGNYDAVLPIIRVCTILDPKQIDIFSTGMWHIAYNFTDEEQRSDRRYIPSALALGKEGTRQNPNTYELFFETGWIWYHKIDDEYHQAPKWFFLGQERPDMQVGRKNLLTNAYIRNNELNKALDLYWELYENAQTRLAEEEKAGGNPFQLFQIRDTIEGNLDSMIVRMVQRGALAQKRGDSMEGYDTSPKFDVGFSARVTVEDPGVLLVTGTWNVAPVGTRVRIVLRDAELQGAAFAQLDWDGRNDVDLDPPRDTTFMQDQLFVKNQRFRKRIDMSRDPTMYPFASTSKKYLVEFYYNPRSAPPHIQDKFGFNGEGFTDKNFLRTDVRKNFEWAASGKDALGFTDQDKMAKKDIGGQQPVMYTFLELTREQLKRQGEWRDKVPAVQTKNFDMRKLADTNSDVIMVPTLRGQAGGSTTPPPSQPSMGGGGSAAAPQ
jgi:hypothetical protein